MFCYKCGKQIDDNSEFCENCGTKLKENAGLESSAPTDIKNKGDTPEELPTTIKTVRHTGCLIIVILVTVVLIVIGIVISEVLDNKYQKKKDEAIQSVQKAYFEFLPEMTVGDLLFEYYGEDNWAYNVDDVVEFWGTNQKDKSGLALHFTPVESNNTVGVTYIKYHKENETAHDISEEAFESYILDLYSSYKGTDKASNKTVFETSAIETEKTAVQTTTKTTTTTTEKSNDKTYSITFEADELIEEAGLELGGHAEIAVLSNLTCSNGYAIPFIEPIYIHDYLTYDSLINVEVTDAEAGEVVLSGTITTYGLNENNIYYSVDSGVFLISKTVGENLAEKPYIE